MELYAPTPTAETKDLSQRFSIPFVPQLTIVQMIIAAVIIFYAYSARKVSGVVVGTLALTMGLLHMYDHLYRIQRGPEKLFFLSDGDKKEQYCSTGTCGM